METATIEIFDETACELGEGAAYDADTGTAWWFDIKGRALFEAELASRAVRRHALPEMASVIVPVDAGRHLLATETGLYLRERASGRLELLKPLEADDASTRSNDGRVHPCGALWIGTMGKTEARGAGAIYWFFRGELRRLYAQVTIPNAICFSPDGTTGYFTDTEVGILHRVSLDPSTGLPTGEPATLYDHRGKDGGLDGAVVDAEGLIWNASYGAGRVDAYSPQGERVRSVAVPARQPTCPVFVGDGLDRLLLTSAAQGLGEGDHPDPTPSDGQTFLLEIGARGLPAPFAKVFAQ